MPKRGRHAVSALGGLFAAAQRRLAEETASGAVEGTFSKLQAELPDLTSELKGILDRWIVSADGESGAQRLVHELAAAAAGGALEAFAESERRGGLPTQRLVGELDELLKQLSGLVARRAEELVQPGARAELAAKSFVQGAAAAMREAAPQLQADVAGFVPSLQPAAVQLGRGLARGILDILARPLTIAAASAAAGALVGAFLVRLGARRRL